jgi:hypothetical protein
MSMVGFPLLLIPLAIYNIVVMVMPGVSFTDPLVRLRLMSGAEWGITLADMLLALGVLMLLFEVIKGARPGAKYLTDHLLSLIVFGAAAAEFLLWPKFGTSVYCLLTMMSLADFLSGVALRVNRGGRARPPASTPGDVVGKAAPVEARIGPEPTSKPAAEPHIASAPAPSAPVPSAVSVAESVLKDHPEPKPVQPRTDAAQAEPSPSIASEKLQPTTGAPASPEAPQD